MEPKFQTSFIPKRPLAGLGVGNTPVLKAPPRRVTSIYMIISVTIFVISLAGIGGAYGWKQYQLNRQENLKKDLSAQEKKFNISSIEQLKQVDVQISTAKQLLKSHLAVSQIFSIVSLFTTENVRFLNLQLTTPNALGGDIKLTLTGMGRNLMSVAFQSQVLSSLEKYGLRSIVKNPIMSDPDVAENGTAGFTMEATIDPKSLSYEKNVKGGLPVETPQP